MSDIGLLMTSILVTEQQPSPNLLQQPLIQPENGLFEATSTQNLEFASTVKVAPPEFMQFSDASSITLLSLKQEVKNILSVHLDKVRSRNLVNLVQAKSSPTIAVNVVPPQFLSDFDAQDNINRGYSRFRSPRLPNVEFGSSGVVVRVLQRLLVSNGYAIEVDGFFGALTEAAVKAFQNQRNLARDGIVGQQTWNELTL